MYHIKYEFGSTNDRSVKHTRAFRIQGTLPCKFLRGMLITKCSDVDYIAKAYCRSLSKVQRVSVEASLSVVAHSYEGEDAANLLKGRSHIGGPSCRRQESERQSKKHFFGMLPICDHSSLVFICTSNDWPSRILLHLLVVRGRDFDHFGHRRIPTDLLVRRQSYFDKCNSSSRY